DRRTVLALRILLLAGSLRTRDHPAPRARRRPPRGSGRLLGRDQCRQLHIGLPPGPGRRTGPLPRGLQRSPMIRIDLRPPPLTALKAPRERARPPSGARRETNVELATLIT